MNLDFIDNNLKEIEDKITAACSRCGRDRNEVTLIAISKTKPAAMIERCIGNGITFFGENKAQELMDKQSVIDGSSSLHWNFIGHLQRNKVKYIVGNVDLIHSVDSERLADSINEQSKKKNVISDVLIEVNVAMEESKFGVSCEEAPGLAQYMSTLSNIRLRGLMTIAPYVDNPEINRPLFAKLRKLLIDINSKNIDNVNMDVLSMGMTGDYEVAIEEGATMVRIGTGIFGERIYNI